MNIGAAFMRSSESASVTRAALSYSVRGKRSRSDSRQTRKRSRRRREARQFFSVELLEQRQMLAADFELSITDTLGTLND